MTSKLKCPVCPFCGGEFDIISIKRKMLGCPKCLHIADGAFWKKAIQAKQDLKTISAKYAQSQKSAEIATNALYEICNDYQEDSSERAEKALKQIDHIADVSKMLEHKEQK